jgi:hypothetical protein
MGEWKSRADAIADGDLIDVTEEAAELSIPWPVAFTKEAWRDLVAWHARNVRSQSTSARLAATLLALRSAIRPWSNNPEMDQVLVTITRMPNTRTATQPRRTLFWVVCETGDLAEPVITVKLYDEGVSHGS